MSLRVDVPDLVVPDPAFERRVKREVDRLSSPATSVSAADNLSRVARSPAVAQGKMKFFITALRAREGQSRQSRRCGLEVLVSLITAHAERLARPRMLVHLVETLSADSDTEDVVTRERLVAAFEGIFARVVPAYMRRKEELRQAQRVKVADAIATGRIRDPGTAAGGPESEGSSLGGSTHRSAGDMRALVEQATSAAMQDTGAPYSARWRPDLPPQVLLAARTAASTRWTPAQVAARRAEGRRIARPSEALRAAVPPRSALRALIRGEPTEGELDGGGDEEEGEGANGGGSKGGSAKDASEDRLGAMRRLVLSHQPDREGAATLSLSAPDSRATGRFAYRYAPRLHAVDLFDPSSKRGFLSASLDATSDYILSGDSVAAVVLQPLVRMVTHSPNPRSQLTAAWVFARLIAVIPESDVQAHVAPVARKLLAQLLSVLARRLHTGQGVLMEAACALAVLVGWRALLPLHCRLVALLIRGVMSLHDSRCTWVVRHRAAMGLACLAVAYPHAFCAAPDKSILRGPPRVTRRAAEAWSAVSDGQGQGEQAPRRGTPAKGSGDTGSSSGSEVGRTPGTWRRFQAPREVVEAGLAASPAQTSARVGDPLSAFVASSKERRAEEDAFVSHESKRRYHRASVLMTQFLGARMAAPTAARRRRADEEGADGQWGGGQAEGGAGGEDEEEEEEEEVKRPGPRALASADVGSVALQAQEEGAWVKGAVNDRVMRTLSVWLDDALAHVASDTGSTRSDNTAGRAQATPLPGGEQPAGAAGAQAASPRGGGTAPQSQRARSPTPAARAPGWRQGGDEELGPFEDLTLADLARVRNSAWAALSRIRGDSVSRVREAVALARRAIHVADISAALAGRRAPPTDSDLYRVRASAALRALPATSSSVRMDMRLLLARAVADTGPGVYLGPTESPEWLRRAPSHGNGGAYRGDEQGATVRWLVDGKAGSGGSGDDGGDSISSSSVSGGDRSEGGSDRAGSEDDDLKTVSEVRPFDSERDLHMEWSRPTSPDAPLPVAAAAAAADESTRHGDRTAGRGARIGAAALDTTATPRLKRQQLLHRAGAASSSSRKAGRPPSSSDEEEEDAGTESEEEEDRADRPGAWLSAPQWALERSAAARAPPPTPHML